jgi:hypothetical protein
MLSLLARKSVVLVISGVGIGVLLTVTALAIYGRVIEQSPPLSEDYLAAENSVTAALAEAFGGHLGSGNPVVQRHVENAHVYQRLYHFDSAAPSEYAHDTEDFYPWLRDHMVIQVMRASGQTDDVRDKLEGRFTHAEHQIQSAIYEPDSGIGIAFREMESEARLQYGTGSEIYWDRLIEPYLEGLSSWAPSVEGSRESPQISLERSMFLNVQQSYELERRRGTIPSEMYFGDYLAENEYLPRLMR